MAQFKQRPPNAGTIGSTARVGHSITVNCGNRNCLHRAMLDLGKLRANLGDEYPIASLAVRLCAANAEADGPNCC